VSSNGCRARFRQVAVGTNCVNRGVVGVGVAVEDIRSIVDDGVCGSGDPVALGVGTCSVQVSVCGIVIAFEVENADFVGSIGAIHFIQILKNTIFVVAPTRSAPSGGEIKDDLVAFVEKVVEVVLHPIDVGGSKIGGDTP
jgi:hypothetical protein